MQKLKRLKFEKSLKEFRDRSSQLKNLVHFLSAVVILGRLLTLNKIYVSALLTEFKWVNAYKYRKQLKRKIL